MTTDLIAGLEVTAIGMGLVFLTLIIVMLVIQALGRIFRGQTLEEIKAEARPAHGPVDTHAPQDAWQPAVAEAAAQRASDEAVAIAVAIALEKTRLNHHQEQDGQDEQECLGEVISVAAIESNGGAWGSYSRLQAVR